MLTAPELNLKISFELKLKSDHNIHKKKKNTLGPQRSPVTMKNSHRYATRIEPKNSISC